MDDATFTIQDARMRSTNPGDAIMKLTKKQVQILIDAGLDHESHHAKLRSQLKKMGFDAVDKDMIAATRITLERVANGSNGPTPDELRAKAEAQAAMVSGANGRAKILQVTEISTRGTPARVVIECLDPQVDGQGNSVCEGTREIAIQDHFQVTRCVPCQARRVQLYRNDRARARRSAKKAAKK